MLFGEKINVPAPGEVSGKPCLPAPRSLRGNFLSTSGAQPEEDRYPAERDFDTRTLSPDLRGVLGTLRKVRRRVLANSLLRSGTKWFLWVLIALLAVGAASSKLAGALVFVAALSAVAAGVVVARAWRMRGSLYEAARRLDSSAGLKDRTSTAIYFGAIPEPGEMIRKQRRDALARVASAEARSLFPIQLPAKVGRAAVLLLVVAALFAYRMNHQAPFVSLLRTAARSQFAQSVLAPMVRAMEKDLERAVALVTTKPEVSADARGGENGSTNDDPWKSRSNDEAGMKEEPQNSAGEADSAQAQLQPGDQQNDPSGEARQEEGAAQSQEGQNASDGSGKAQQGDSQGAENRQSLGQSLMQALKNMFSNSQGQQANNRAGQQQPSGQGMPQTGNSHQPGSTDSDKRGESRGSSDAKQKATQTASEGAGNQPGSKELRKDQEARPVNAIPDRVALESSGFKDKTRMNVATETGVAQLPVRDESAQGDAVTNGAEQENIPARYRLYVQRYFEHADNGKH